MKNDDPRNDAYFLNHELPGVYETAVRATPKHIVIGNMKLLVWLFITPNYFKLGLKAWKAGRLVANLQEE